jgi:hypothetical protein
VICCCGGVYGLFVLAYLCRYYLSALDSNDTESIEEGKVFGYQGEDQGKPSKLDSYLILFLLIACFINVYETAGFYIVITSR